MKNIHFLLLLLPVQGFSQTRNESWSRIHFSYTINTRWTAEADLQYRSQSNFKTTDKNIFHYTLGYSGRVWFHYQLSGNWKLIVSPVGYFISNKIPGESATAEKKQDIRLMAGISKAFVKKKWSIKNRLLYEVGFIDFRNNTNHLQNRYRLLNNFTFPFAGKSLFKNTGYQLANEIFFRTSENKTSFDQNRVYNALIWKKNKTEATAGYQWVVQKDKSIFTRNQFLITFKIFIVNRNKSLS